MSADDYRLATQVKFVKSQKLPKGRALNGGEMVALLNTCDGSPAGVRDAALISVTYGAGLRRAEVVGLDLADFDPTSFSLTVRGGKGDKDRIAYIGDGPSAALADWLAVRGHESGPLFLAVNKGGKVRSGRLNPQTVFDILERKAKAAGVQVFSPHDLRRTFISDLLDRGADIATVQRMAGHASVTTTAKYDRRGEAAKQKAAGLLHVPYQPKKPT